MEALHKSSKNIIQYLRFGFAICYIAFILILFIQKGPKEYQFGITNINR